MKVVVEETTQTRHLGLVVERVDLLEKLQTLVVILNVVAVPLVLRALQSVNRVEFHLH